MPSPSAPRSLDRAASRSAARPQRGLLAAASGCLCAALAACGGPQPQTVDAPAVTTPTTVDEQPTGPTGPSPEELAAMRQEQAEDAFVQAAVLLRQSRDGANADRVERLFTEAMEKNPEYTPEAWFNIGLARQHAGDRQGAMEAYRAATAADPQFARGLANIGYLQLVAGDTAAAEATFQECLRRLDTEPGCNINLAVMYRQGTAAYQGDLVSAMIERYRFALGGDAHNGEAYANLSQIYFEQGQYELARMTCESAILLGIDEGVLHNRLGLIALRMDDVITAYAEFRNAVERDPSLIEAWINIGAMALSFRDYDAALEAFEIVLQERPDDLDVRLSYGAALRGLDRPEEARAAYDEVLRRSPNHPGALFNMALLYQEAYQDYPQACGQYRQYLSVAPSSAAQYPEARRRLENLGSLLDSLVFLGEATQEQADACRP